MSRSPASELPEALDFLHGDRQLFQHFAVLVRLPARRPDEAWRRAAWRRGRSTARSGRGSATSDLPDRIAETPATGSKSPAPDPWARPDARCWLAVPRQSPRVRIVLMHSVSSCLPVTNACSLATMRCALLSRDNAALLGALLAIPIRVPRTERVSDTHRVYQFLADQCRGICENIEATCKNGGNGRGNGRRTDSIYFSSLQVAAFARRCPGGFLDILKKLAEILFFGRIHPAKRMRTPPAGALRVTTPFRARPFTQILPLATQSPISTLAPPLMWPAVSTWHPPMLVFERLPQMGASRVIDPQLNRHKALDSRMPPPVLSRVGAEDIGLKRRSGRGRGRQGLR